MNPRDMGLHGKNLIGGESLEGDEAIFYGVDPTTEKQLPPAYRSASIEQLRHACMLADEAFATYRKTSLSVRAAFLEAIADEIETLGDELVDRAVAETGLPEPRIRSERGRTTGQLRMFAKVVRDGSFLDRRVVTAAPDRKPAPRPELRYVNIPLGPVAVFGASNFPLAFSVAGGDTAAALASGCPVVCKAHPAHPGTAELVGHALARAIRKSDFHPGTFSLVFDARYEIGAALVTDPHIKAVAFTGSRSGGLALSDIAGRRSEPIPVYAEMGSINPLFILPRALASDAAGEAQGWLGSLQLGAGQFCTNPGLLVVLETDGLSQFIESLADSVGSLPPQQMLSSRIHAAYQQGIERLEAHPGTRLVGRGLADDAMPNGCQVHVFQTSADAFMADSRLGEEVFGACGLIVRCTTFEEMLSLAAGLEGQLTATVHASGDDDCGHADALLGILERKAGRIVLNGYPTGVEVSEAMAHGGPFPATTDSRSTSVGTSAIQRFLRPVCYQDCPSHLLSANCRNG